MQPAITGGPANKKSRLWKTAGVLFLVSVAILVIDTFELVQKDVGWECGGKDGFVEKEVPLSDVDDGFEDCSDGSDESQRAIGFKDDVEDTAEPIDEFLATTWALSCCGSFVFMILALSARNQQVMYVQRGFTPTVSQPVIPQQIVHSSMPVPRPQVVQPQAPQPVVTPLTQPRKSSPQDLEKARDFEAAADEYQRLGMYAEAGRVRAMHLEKEQPLVSIGNVGDTILNDSVMVSNEDSTQKKCPSCGKEVDPSFNLCPYCKQNL